MGWLGNWFGASTSATSSGQTLGGSASMSLEERMAFRRQMVLASVKEVMSNFGLLTTGYRATLARLDARGHQFAVMIEMYPSAAGRTVDSAGELHAMEERITIHSMRRYKITVSGVYWRLLGEQVQPAVAKVAKESPTMGEARGSQQPDSKPTLLRRKNDVPLDDGFPDTQLENRSEDLDMVSAEELEAFERAIGQGQSPHSVQLGRRTYETDFAPLP